MDENIILNIIDDNYKQDIINFLIDIIITRPEELLKNHEEDLKDMESLDLDKDNMKLTDIFIWKDDGNQLEFQLYIENNFKIDDKKILKEVKNTLICKADKDEFLNNFHIFDLI